MAERDSVNELVEQALGLTGDARSSFLSGLSTQVRGQVESQLAVRLDASSPNKEITPSTDIPRTQRDAAAIRSTDASKDTIPKHISASAIAATLLLGAVGTTGGIIWALAERKEAVAARKAENAAKREAIANAEQAQAEAIRATAAEKHKSETLVQVAAERDAEELAWKEAEQISAYLAELLQSPAPTRDDREIKVVELLDNAAKKLETDLVGQPAQRARLQHTLGKTFYALGLYQQSIPLFEQVLILRRKLLGQEHPETLAVMNNLANSYAAGGRLDEAFQLLIEVLPLSRKVLGAEHPETLTAMENLAFFYRAAGWTDEAFQLQEEVLTLRRKVLGPEHPETLAAMGNLANSYHDVGRQDEALQLREEVLPVFRKVNGLEHPDTLAAMSNLAVSYYDVGRLEEALQLQEKVLALRRNVSGPEHPLTLQAMSSLAVTYFDIGRRDDALQLRKEAFALYRKINGPEHPITLMAMGNLAVSYHDAGLQDEARQLREEVLKLYRKLLGPEHPETLTAMTNLATSYRDAGRQDEALQLSEEALKLYRDLFIPKNPETLNVMQDLANAYAAAGRRDEALQLTAELLALRPDDPDALNQAAWILATSPDKDGRYPQPEQAVAWARRANELAPDSGGLLNTLGVALYRAEQWQEAINALQKSRRFGFDTPVNWLFIGMSHWQLDQKDQGTQWYDKALDWEADNPDDLQADAELQSFFAEAVDLLGTDSDAQTTTEALVEPAVSDPANGAQPENGNNDAPSVKERAK